MSTRAELIRIIVEHEIRPKIRDVIRRAMDEPGSRPQRTRRLETLERDVFAWLRTPACAAACAASYRSPCAPWDIEVDLDAVSRSTREEFAAAIRDVDSRLSRFRHTIGGWARVVFG